MNDPQTILVTVLIAVGTPLVVTLVYWLLRPRIWISIKSPQPVSMVPGIPAEVIFRVSRWRYSGELVVHIDGLPEWLSTEFCEIPCGGQHGRITLTAKAGVLPESLIEVRVVAGAETVHASVHLKVASLKPDRTSSTLIRPPLQLPHPPSSPLPSVPVTLAVVEQAALHSLLDNSSRFFLCNTNRRHSSSVEDLMRQKKYAAAWEPFAWSKHMQRVREGDTIFMWGKNAGIIGIGRATGECETVDASDPGRIRSPAEYAEREWRVPVEWVVWVVDRNACPCDEMGNCTFKDASKEEYRTLRDRVRKHFLGPS